ncbi:hypothetical protein K6T82_18095 [Flavobacterium sp. 17A]|uniref:Uncharacterized protein n=1 Tax=Flavobacterium potami TaxID=2872310 RepID=A0A9X1HE50_9FLAO|nr:hypothetical protein [Flavobacterium potami]MBZ4036687.1 hypothetical protein [Flavobacterium potami]
MKNLIFTVGFLCLIGIHSANAQVASDSLKITSDNCATKLAKEYMVKMGTIDQVPKKDLLLRSSELLKGTDFEKESNGVFLISTFNAHRRKLIVLKKENQIKLLTFNNVGESLIELISFLDDSKTSNDELLKYLDAIQVYLKYSEKTIKAGNKINNSDWLKCE